MLRFFQLNDPYRLFGVLVIMLFLRLPYWLAGPEWTIPQLTWFLIGDRMSEGFIMYKEIWAPLGPLSGAVYWILESLFGRSQWALQIFGLLLGFVQAAIFNTLAINTKAYSESTYIPSVVYGVLVSSYFDFFGLSPALMGTTFILLALTNIFNQIEVRAKRDEKILKVGLYLGIGTLFYFPLVIFGPAALLLFILFTSTVRRRYFLMVFGWILPLALAGCYFYLRDGFELFARFFLLSWVDLTGKKYIDNASTLVLAAVPAFFVLIALLRLFRGARVTNYQVRLIQSVLLLFTLSSLVLFLEIDRNPYLFIVFVPFCAFFISHYFTFARSRALMPNLMFLLFIIAPGVVNYFSLSSSDLSNIRVRTSGYYINQDEAGKYADIERLTLLNDNISGYRYSFPSSPFIHWDLSKSVWVEPDRYANLAVLVTWISTEKPPIIVDEQNYLRGLLNEAPGLESDYIREEDRWVKRVPE